MSQQADSEQAIFRLFAQTVDLPVVPDSIESRNPPEPDIRCIFMEAGPRCFELVEVVDSDLAKAIGIQVKFQSRLEAIVRDRRVKGVADALVFVRFSSSTTNSQKQHACDVIVNVLERLPNGFVGSIDPGDHGGLIGVVRKLQLSRGTFVGPAFQVDGGAFISDPIIERLREKFEKTYTTDAPVELLAYYELHPTARAEFELPGVGDYVRANLRMSPFSRVWVFDVANRRLLYCS
jgi:hypothetical protein